MDYESRLSKRKTMSLTVTKELTVLVKAPFGTPEKVIDDFVNSHIKWIEEHTAIVSERNLKYGELSEQRKCELRALAKSEIPRRVEYFADIMQLYPASIKITSAQGRFGSCSGKNSLCFSYRLMLYPPQAIDYVVVHELAHIKHKNHSAAFYALVENYLPDYKEREKLLKQ